MAPALARVREEDEAVKELILEALDVIRSDDFDRYFDLFAEDAVWMMPSSFKDVHQDEARSFYRFTSKFKFDQETAVDEVVVSGDVAYVRVSFDGYLRPKVDDGSPPLRSVSRHIWILRRQSDGSWKIARDIWNTPKGITLNNQLMRGVRPDIALLEQNGITGVAMPRLGDPSVIPLWFGEGDVVTPEFIRAAAKRALDDGDTFYVNTRGTIELRAAIRDYTNNLYGTSIDVERVSVPGSSMLGVTIAAQMALNKGDDALVVSPHWPNIETTYAVTGANVITVRQRETPSGWQLTADEIIEVATPKTRSIFVNSPCNPTGWVMPREEQEKLLAFCRENDVLLIADEVYHRHFYQADAAPSFIEIAEEEDPVVIVNGFSKAWAMTGWRLGWVITPKSQGTHWAIMSECFNTGSTVFAQRAGITALEQGERTVHALKQQYQQGRDLLIQKLGQHPHIDLCAPEGAFYAFPRIKGIQSSRTFAEQLLAEADVGVAPGYTFGAGNDEYIRICFALGQDRLSEGLDRIVRFIDRQ